MKPGESITLTLESDFESVRQALSKIIPKIQPILDAEKAVMVELALAETLNNVVEHAYGEKGGNEINVDLAYDGAALCCSIIDHGIANPSLANIEENASQPGDMAEGGYGNNLINMLASQIEYYREGERNLTKVWF